MGEMRKFDTKLLKKVLLKQSYVLVLWGLLLTLLYYLGVRSYRLFHIGVEFYTVVVAFIAYVIVINTYEISQNSHFTFLAIAFGFVGLLDVMHLLTHEELKILAFTDTNTSMQTWIIARYMQGIAIILSFIYLNRKINKTIVNLSFLAITAIAVIDVFYTKIFPACYIPGKGMTAFKNISELIISILFITSIILLVKFKKKLRYRVYRNLLFSLVIAVLGALLNSIYDGISIGIMVIAHIFKFIGYYYFYSAIIVTTLKSPINSMYYELDSIRDELAEKNLEVMRTNERLKQDIEDLQTIEKLLRRSKAWSRAIFEGSSIGIVLLNINGAIIEANPAFERIIGYKAEELRDMDIKVLTHPDDYHYDSSLHSKLIEGVIESYNIEKRYIRKDGNVIWGNLEMSFIQNRGEDFQFIIAMVEDITQRKQDEAKQKQLLKELELINQELDSFAYIVSHDLKAPLRGIGSLADWLSNDYADKLDAEGKDIINLMTNRVERMKNFIDGILEYSRVSKINEAKTEVDLNKVVNDTIELIQPPNNITISIENKLPIIKNYRIFMEQIFQNIIGNSIKFMDKPIGVIIIKSEEINGFWKISISDNGPGIEERYYKKIFQIFQTLQPRDKFESTGIGLSIVKKIIETSGGSIWVESEPGKGSTFYFTLPKN